MKFYFPHVRLFRGAVGDKFVFMDDSATMLWGGKLLVETILRQTRTPSSVHSQREWDKLPQQLLDNVVQSMVRRVECCITLHGGHIPY
ncbi:hypothetical protein TNCV_1721261 [Trichonephila clavipes]|nr:hypothetical protein TNCV_1721261 [Trichonephila clavipes]